MQDSSESAPTVATSPATDTIKVPIAAIAYVSRMLGFAIKEALDGQDLHRDSNNFKCLEI